MVVAAVVVSIASPGAATSAPAVVCTWGGTAAAPTGALTIRPGLTNTPAPTPLRIFATGDLSGAGCADRLTFIGTFDAGSTCAVFTLGGRAMGIPVVATWEGGGTLLSADLLYDKQGKVVGSDQPNVITAANVANAGACDTAEGLTRADFSATVELIG